MLVTKEWIAENFKKFNDLLYEGKLPTPIFKTSMTKKVWGRASYKIDFVNRKLYNFSITLSNYYDSPEEVKQNTLIHEMIHLADYTFHPERFLTRRRSKYKYDAHGEKFFIPECQRIKKFGYDINKNATDKEYDASKLNTAVEEKLKRLKQNKYQLYIGVVDEYYSKKAKRLYNFVAIKASDKLTVKKYLRLAISMGMREIILINTNYEKFLTKRPMTKSGIYITDEVVEDILKTADIIYTSTQIREIIDNIR